MNLMKTMQTWSTTEDAVLNALRQGPLTVSQLIKCGATFVNAAAALTKRKSAPVIFVGGKYLLAGIPDDTRFVSEPGWYRGGEEV